ncbi:MAG: polyphosphate kinase 1 [Candidatus Accumulibacter sp.]|jgi:polyphosphate kinase|nr:polyphosphate kinase 1 [Accumulibacter sp.]
MRKTAAGHEPAGYPATNYLNRELGILAFNRRVLAQAKDAATPLLERLRFLCIVSSNLDEFFEIRVAGLREQVKLHSVSLTPDGLSAQGALESISREAHAMVEEQYALLNREILPGLAAKGIAFLRRGAWDEAQFEWIRDYFFREVMPVLTPIGLDPSHPFPRLLNKSLNFAIELEGKDAFGRSIGKAIVQAPRVLPRVIRLPKELCACEYGFVFLSSVLHEFVGELFSGMNVLGCYQFRVTRNSDLFIDEEEVKNLRETIQGELPQRHFSDAVVRLEVSDSCSPAMTEFLLGEFGLTGNELYTVAGPVNLVRLMRIPELVRRGDLLFAPFKAGMPKTVKKTPSIFDSIHAGDILLHHPYQSFAPVIELLDQAAVDPRTVAIKMTVYRTGTDSVLMQSLLRAAQNGKEVTVVVELMARFDEEANIGWATKLERVGAHVVYGVVGYKTHCKMLMIVRRDEGRPGSVLRRYVHLGTGNYNPVTARLYSDFSLLTCNEEIGDDVNEVFKQLTGLGLSRQHKHVWQAPFTLHANMLAAIREEAAAARAGKPARIIAKMNSLLEQGIIDALYDASCAGVRIDLIVRGVCALRPGIKGLSEKIRVRSIVGRFLEHHRVFYFHAGGKEKVLLASADWMERNFFRRIETAFPILDRKIKRRVINEGLRVYLADNRQAWEMDAAGGYRPRRAARGKPRCAQEELIALLKP